MGFQTTFSLLQDRGPIQTIKVKALDQLVGLFLMKKLDFHQEKMKEYTGAHAYAKKEKVEHPQK